MRVCGRVYDVCVCSALPTAAVHICSSLPVDPCILSSPRERCFAPVSILFSGVRGCSCVVFSSTLSSGAVLITRRFLRTFNLCVGARAGGRRVRACDPSDCRCPSSLVASCGPPRLASSTASSLCACLYPSLRCVRVFSRGVPPLPAIWRCLRHLSLPVDLRPVLLCVSRRVS